MVATADMAAAHRDKTARTIVNDITAGRLAEAEAAWRQARRQWPDAPDLVLLRGWLDLRGKKTQKAIAAVKRHLAAGLSAAGVVRLGLANDLLAAGEWGLARSLIQDMSREPLAYYLLSRIGLACGDIDAALDHLRTMADRWPDDPGGITELAMVLLKQGRWKEALLPAALALRKWPERPQVVQVAAFVNKVAAKAARNNAPSGGNSRVMLTGWTQAQLPRLARYIPTFSPPLDAELRRLLQSAFALLSDTAAEPLTLFEGPGGFRMVVDIRDGVTRDMVLGNGDEVLCARILARCCQRRDIVLDLGAHAGLYSLATATQMGQGARVFAVESAPAAFSLMQQNIRLNGFEDRITLVSSVVCGGNGAVPIQGTAASDADGPVDGGAAAEGRTLAGLCKDLELTHVDVLKLDIAGRQAECLMSGVDVVSAAADPLIQMRVMIDTMNVDDVVVLLQLGNALEEAGFSLFVLDDVGIHPSKLNLVLERAQTCTLYWVRPGGVRALSLKAAASEFVTDGQRPKLPGIAADLWVTTETLLARYSGISQGPGVRPGNAVDPASGPVDVKGDMPLTGLPILGAGMEWTQARVASLCRSLTWLGRCGVDTTMLNPVVHAAIAGLHPPGRRDLRVMELGAVRLYVDLSDRFGQFLFYGLSQELHDVAFFAALLGPGAVVLDVGANIGLYSTVIGQHVAQGGRLLAFEPHAGAAALLERNIALNGLTGTVTLMAAAVAEQDGVAEFFEMQESAFSGLHDTHRSTVSAQRQVPVCRIDTICAGADLTSIDALKIDVEGHEGLVLTGAMNILRASPDPVIQFEVSAKNYDDALWDSLWRALTELRDNGFVHYQRREQDGALLKVGPDEMNDQRSNGNHYLVRAGSTREALLLHVAERHRPSVLIPEGDQQQDLKTLVRGFLAMAR